MYLLYVLVDLLFLGCFYTLFWNSRTIFFLWLSFVINWTIPEVCVCKSDLLSLVFEMQSLLHEYQPLVGWHKSQPLFTGTIYESSLVERKRQKLQIKLITHSFNCDNKRSPTSPYKCDIIFFILITEHHKKNTNII